MLCQEGQVHIAASKVEHILLQVDVALMMFEHV